jgi:hypothetical protein
MNGNPLVRDTYGSISGLLPNGQTAGDFATDIGWYRIIVQLLPSLRLTSHDGRILFQLDPAELRQILPTSFLIKFYEAARTEPSVPATAASPADRCYQRWLTFPLHAQLAEVAAALSLNKTQLAEVLDVSRPTIYQWMDEQRAVADDRTDTARLTTLLRLMAQAGISGTEALNARFTKVPLEIHGKGLLALLFEKTWDEARVLAGLIQARDITRAAQRERAEREARLAAQGFATPTAEEREATLERTLFLEGLDAP